MTDELRLISTPDGPRLVSSPVKELESLRAKSHRLGSMNLQPDSANPLAQVKTELMELRTEFGPGAAEIIFSIRGATITYDAQKQELDVNGFRVPAPLRGNRQRLAVYCDRTTLEVFASDGLVGVPVPFLPKAGDLQLGVHVRRGEVKFQSLDVHELKSAWLGQ